MTNILVITNMFPPHHLGGYELSCADVVRRWRERGHDVAVLTSDMRLEGVEDPPDERSQAVDRSLRLYWADHRVLAPNLREQLAIERANQRALARALATSRPDVVSIWHLGALSMGILTTLMAADLPIVLVVCDDWLVYGPRMDAWSRRFLGRPRLGRIAERLTGLPATLPDLGRAGTYCFVSESTRRAAREHTPWQFPDSTVVYSGVDRRDFPPLEQPDPERPWAGRLLYVGRLDARKGAATLVRATALVGGNHCLEIVGRGDDREAVRLRELAASLGIGSRVRFDAVPRHELRERYRAADVVVFPSEWAEPFGLIPLEAMACGTPVIATGTGGSGEYLRHEMNCLLYQAGDADQLAAEIRRLAGDPDLRRRLIEGGLRTIELLDTDQLAGTLDAWHLAAARRFADGRPRDRELPAVAQ